MDVQLKFLGGAKTVTGSKYLLKIDSYQILVDCGLFQGGPELRIQNWQDLQIDINEIDAILLTHGHLDHTGYLPRLCKAGYKGPIYCTTPTEDLLELLLRDSAKLQEEEAEFARKKGYSKHEKPEPLYTTKDVEAVFPLIHSVPFHKSVPLTKEIFFKFYYAGHILGASFIEIIVSGSYQHKKIVFSGDLGRYDDPILYPPEKIPSDADIVLIETTYGGKDKSNHDVSDEFAEVICKTAQNNGMLVIPAFSIGRTQLVLWHIENLMSQQKIPAINIYMDSPMAISASELYLKHLDHHKITPEDLQTTNFKAFEKKLHVVREHSASILLNEIKGPGIIISAAGMMNGGRILHHLYNRISNKNNCVVVVGYQAKGTRGDQLLKGAKAISIFGQSVPVNCDIKYIDGMSAHADQGELSRWLEGLNSAPKKLFLIHGEIESAEAFQTHLMSTYKWPSIIPNQFETFSLFEGI